jgi:hypothetical protein
LKVLALLFLSIFSIQVLADKPVEEAAVNFFTLAANAKALDGQKVSVVGWIKFVEYESEKSILLFHSKSSLSEFRVEESIQIRLPEEDYKAASEYLNLKLVTVYAKFTAPKSIGSLGKLLDVKDIDIRAIESDI